MNWEHLKAFIWLRWRLMRNQWRRAGTVNAVLMSIIVIGALILAIPLFLGTFALGWYVIPKAAPEHLLYAWDGLVVGFLFMWMIGLVADLQRSEPLSLAKFLHLPVSVTGAFIINYVSSLMRLTLIVYGPIMLGFSSALIVTKGLSFLLVLPLLTSFLVMITALTYQFQGWLASLMSNPRRRRTVIMITTGTFVMLAQLPNLLNFFGPLGPGQQMERANRFKEELAKLERDFRSKKIDATEHARLQKEVIEKNKLSSILGNRETAERWRRTARIANLVLPFGWLPLGVMSEAEGRILPSVLGTLGMSLIGFISLWRAYRTTVRLYQGQPTNQKESPISPVLAASPSNFDSPPRKPTITLLERKLPGFSEPVSAIALGGFSSLVRSPEAKMMLLTPLIMCAVFGSMVLRGTPRIPELARPLLGIGGLAIVFFSVLQIMGNQFGFDRDGFRVFVLSSASRRDILLGKNLIFLPVTLVMGAILLTIVQAVCPMRLDHLLAMVPQYLSMYLLFCLLANLFSILAPIYIAAGSLKPSNPKLTTILLQLVMFLILFPLIQGLTLLPLGVEVVLNLYGWTTNVPVYLLLSLLECAVIAVLYWFLLEALGSLLQTREQTILESVTNRES